jgi:hypothetical protein
MDVLKKWDVYCCTESNVQQTWRFYAPTCCPNNPSHVIDPLQTEMVDKKALNTGTANTYVAKSWQDTNGYYQMHGYRFDVPAGSNFVSWQFALPTKRCLFGIRANATAANVGDRFSVSVDPGTPVGYVTSDVFAGHSNIPVSSTVTANMVPGFYAQIGDEDEHMIDRIGLETNIILVDPIVASNIPMYTPVLANVYIVKDFEIGCLGVHKAGYGTMAGKVLPAGTVIRFGYENLTGGEKTFSFNSEYTY